MESDREKILELITKTMNEYDYREPSEEYASHDCDFADSQAARSKSAHFRTLGFESDYYRVAIRKIGE
jgi:hypothetical protein